MTYSLFGKTPRVLLAQDQKPGALTGRAALRPGCARRLGSTRLGMGSREPSRSIEIDSDEEEMPPEQAPRKLRREQEEPPPLGSIITQELRAIIYGGDGVQSFVMFMLLLLAALFVIGRMIYKDLRRDWVPCSEEENMAKHFYCVNITQVHNVLAVAKKPMKPKH